MKSEYYKQIEVDTFPKKTSNHQQAKRKLISDTATHNALTHSRNFKSEKRSMIGSIDLMRKSKQQIENKAKIFYSKSIIPTQSEAVKYDAQWVDLKCLECDALKGQQAKRIKELQMIYEQQLTEEKEKYIMMEKKYLLKENQYIKLLSDNERFEQSYAVVAADYYNLRVKYESLENSLKTVEIQHDKLLEQTKNQNEKIENLHHFLKLYVQQTKIIINWAHMFEQIQDQLPTLMHLIKQDLLFRRMDFQITLKEAATFQKLNFSQISSNKEEASEFLGDGSGCENFMKYLKHQPRSRVFNQQTSNKKGQSLIDSFNNKENIDFLNGISIKSLLSSNAKDRKSKQKLQSMNDDCLRLLLLQAKTIESSMYLRNDSIQQSRMVQDFSQQRSIFA